VSAYFWSATEYDSYFANGWYLDAINARLSYYDFNKNYGSSVRCLKDSEE